eukprot:8504359-Pyramimonas_sp.AAC.1
MRRADGFAEAAGFFTLALDPLIPGKAGQAPPSLLSATEGLGQCTTTPAVRFLAIELALK